MDYETFVKLCALLAKKYDADLEGAELLLSSVMFDNGVLKISENEYKVLDTNYASLHKFSCRLLGGGADFIWTGQQVYASWNRYLQTGGTSGHVALAQYRGVFCAGRIHDEDGELFLFFHSGHYRPKLRHVIVFFHHFVMKSCTGLYDKERDRLVDKLCQLHLRIYRDNSDKTYDTTFAKLLAQVDDSLLLVDNSSPYIGMSGSKPIQIGGPIKSKPIQIGQFGSNSNRSVSNDFVLTTSNITLVETKGLTSTGELFRTQPVRQWIPNGDALKCMRCSTTFGTFVWKHHCRSCGYVVCDGCSKNKAVILSPLKHPEKSESGPVRICDSCYGKL